MPVTLTLTDEQALEIAAQLGGLLIGKKISLTAATSELAETPKTSKRVPTHFQIFDKVSEKIREMPKGAQIDLRNLAFEMGVETDPIGKILIRLRKMGVVELVQRGLWKRV